MNPKDMVLIVDSSSISRIFIIDLLAVDLLLLELSIIIIIELHGVHWKYGHTNGLVACAVKLATEVVAHIPSMMQWHIQTYKVTCAPLGPAH